MCVFIFLIIYYGIMIIVWVFFIEGGGLFYGIRMIICGENIMIDDGGLMMVNG